MCLRSKIMKKSVIITTCILGLVMTGCSSLTGETKTLESSNVTLVTKVLPYGEVGYAIVCDFGDTVDSSKLNEKSFNVEVDINNEPQKRNIKKIYTNNKIETSEKENEGKYVVIELDTEDENSSTIVFEEERFLNHRENIDYTVTQNVDINTSNGNTFKASEDKIKSSNIVTPVVDDFKKMTYKDSSGNSMDYRLFEPKVEEGKKYPLVLLLHGSGERGSDNDMQLLGNEGGTTWANPELQAKNPSYVLAPQAKAAEELSMYWTEEPNYTLMMDILKETIEKYDIDENRIYVVGMSNGGIGTWNVIEKNPELFAAAVPICGIGNIKNMDLKTEYKPLKDYSVFKDIKDMPIWIFHAEDDPLVDVRYSRDAQKAIKKLGGTSVKYTEYAEGTVMPMGHFSWVPALQDQKMIEWLFNQSKDNN